MTRKSCPAANQHVIPLNTPLTSSVLLSPDYLPQKMSHLSEKEKDHHLVLNPQVLREILFSYVQKKFTKIHFMCVTKL